MDAGALVIVGGKASGAVGADAWAFDGTRFGALEFAAPSAREVYALTYDPVHGGLLLHGGRDPERKKLAALWRLQKSGWEAISR